MKLLIRTQGKSAGLLLFAIVVFFCSTGCDEAPFQPKDDEPVVKDYRVWFWKVPVRDKLFWYHTSTGEVDSAVIPWQLSENPTVSHDGSLIYVPSGDVIKILETESLSTVGEIPIRAREPLVVSPNGMYLAVFGDSTWIVRTSDYSQLYVDTTRWFTGSFSANCESLYIANGSVKRISFSDPNQIFSEILIEGYGVRQVVPVPDHSTLLIYYRLDTFAWAFGVYDIDLDTLLSYDVQAPGNGVFAMTPNGSNAFYGNPGTITGPPGTSELTVFDVESSRMVKRWNMDGLVEEFAIYGSRVNFKRCGNWQKSSVTFR